jgi:hypothetical protein
MYGKLAIASGLIIIALAVSGCCSCCSSFSSGLDDSVSTSPGDADALIGNEWVSSSYLVYGDTSGSYAGDTGVRTSIEFFENGTFVMIGVTMDPHGMGYYGTGRYYVTGDTIKFSHIVEHDYHDMSVNQYTTVNIPDTMGTFSIESDGHYDTMHIQANGLWNSDTVEFSRAKAG